VQDVKDSPRPLASAEMALIRLGYAADLPPPEDALRKLAESAEAAPRLAPQSAPARGPSGGSALRAVAQTAPAPAAPPAPAAAPGVRLARFEDVVALARAKRDIQLQAALENDVRLVRFEAGSIEFSLIAGASAQVAQTLSRRLQEWTGERWMVALVAGSEAPTMRESASARKAERLSGVAANPLVRKVMARFPGAQIVEVRGAEAAPAHDSLPASDDDLAYADAVIVEDDV
jgi:DNA polymerase-3 subunit gamma/tau